MLMHIPTMFLMVIAVSLTMACCTGALWRREQPEGLGYWALGLSLHGIAFILFILREMLPYSLSVVLGNLLLVVAFALFCEAILQFQQRRMPRLWLWWPVVVAGPALAILPDAPSARAVVVACLCTYQASLLLAITFRERDNTAGRGQYFVMLAAALGIITMAVHGLSTGLGTDQALQLTSSTPVQMATFLISCVILILSSMGLVLMTKERADAHNRRLAMHDELTGLPNRRYAVEMLDRLLGTLQRGRHAFSLLMLDIDHFKQINDQCGHLVGDQALQLLADGLRARLRAQDLAARLGGEEFLVILPDTSATGASQLAETLRRSVEQLRLQLDCNGGCPLQMTVSIGVCTVQPGSRLSPLEVIDLADQALYRAKQNGRNRVEVSNLPAPDRTPVATEPAVTAPSPDDAVATVPGSVPDS